MTADVVAIVSGGMDSVCLAHDLARTSKVRLLSFDYGQRHLKELGFAAECADRLGVKWDVITLASVATLLAGSSSLTGGGPVPDGHYAEDTMKATVVPNRNMMMLAVAGAVAVAEGASFVATAVHGGDHFIYPDCRVAFVEATAQALRLGNEGMGDRTLQGILTPYITHDKAYIAKLGTELGVPWDRTWSCYKGQAVHCGACGTCYERREAFQDARVDDPTVYAATPDYADPR